MKRVKVATEKLGEGKKKCNERGKIVNFFLLLSQVSPLQEPSRLIFVGEGDLKDAV